MKFKATLTERGIHSLSKAFLPTLEKFGKSCQVLLAPEQVTFIQTPLEADGAQIALRFQVAVLFQPDAFKVVSRHHNTIAFAVDLSMLLKALHSAVNNDADVIDMKLTQKAVLVPGSEGETENKPFLCITSRGSALNLVQDLPISKPCTPSEINTLAGLCEVPALCPFYLDLAAAQPRLAAAVDRMKALSSVVHLALCKAGDVHIQVVEASVLLGAMFEGLGVFPADARTTADEATRQQTAEQQLQQALDSGDALDVHMSVKHLLKVMAVSSLSQPCQVLIGIPEGAGYVHVLYVYRNPSGDAPYDASIEVNFKLPVREEE